MSRLSRRRKIRKFFVGLYISYLSLKRALWQALIWIQYPNEELREVATSAKKLELAIAVIREETPRDTGPYIPFRVVRFIIRKAGLE